MIGSQMDSFLELGQVDDDVGFDINQDVSVSSCSPIVVGR
jgi:hypothetical protein